VGGSGGNVTGIECDVGTMMLMAMATAMTNDNDKNVLIMT
jgi:hypothetical protein